MIAAINEVAGSTLQVNVRGGRFQNAIRGGFRAALDLRRIDKAAAELLLAASIGLNVVVRKSGSNAAGLHMASGIASVARGWAPTAD